MILIRVSNSHYVYEFIKIKNIIKNGIEGNKKEYGIFSLIGLE
jgi:hypothetical protein